MRAEAKSSTQPNSPQRGDDLLWVEPSRRRSDPDEPIDLRVLRGPDAHPPPSDALEAVHDWPRGEQLEELSTIARDITIRLAGPLPEKLDGLQLNYLRLVRLVGWTDQAVAQYQSARAMLLRDVNTNQDRAAVVQSFGACLSCVGRAVRFADLLTAAVSGGGEGETEQDLAAQRLVALRIAANSTDSFTSAPAAQDQAETPHVTRNGLSTAGEFFSFDDLAASLRWLDGLVDRLLGAMMGVTRAGRRAPA